MNKSRRTFRSLSHEMKAWGFEDKTDFEGLVPKANKKLPVIGKELEVTDVNKIALGSFGYYNDYLNKEYLGMLAEYPNLEFYESHLILNKKLENVDSVEDLKVAKSENIYQVGNYVHTITHDFETGSTTKEVREDDWYNSRVFNPLEEVKISVEAALKAYENSDYRTTGDKITLRSPFVAQILPVYYIIGQQDSPRFVRVDATTGEVGLIQ